MTDWLAEGFAALHQQVFEAGVLPVVYALGLGGWAEQAFDATEIFLIGAIEVTLLAVVLSALEKWRPVEVQADVSSRKLDVVYTLLNRLGFIPLLMFVLLMPFIDALNGALRMADVIPPKLEDAMPWLNSAPLWSFLFYLVLLDFVAYWLHRWQHGFRWWWSLHALHHAQREMSFWSDNRNHLLDDVLRDSILVLVALLVGIAPGQFVAVVAVTQLIESLSHANTRLSFGRWGSRVLVGPQFHRSHHRMGAGHESRGAGSLGGHNFAVLFPVWDLLFGSARFDDRYEPTGVRDQLEGRDYGRGFWAQQRLGLLRLMGRG